MAKKTDYEREFDKAVKLARELDTLLIKLDNEDRGYVRDILGGNL